MCSFENQLFVLILTLINSIYEIQLSKYPLIHRHVRDFDLNVLMSYFEIHDGNNEWQLSF